MNKEKSVISDQISEQMRILILLLNDFSAGVTKLGNMCSFNRMKVKDDFEV